MRVEFLGTAGYHPSETRQTTGIFVPDAAPDDAFLLDAGSGTFRLIGRDLPARLHVFLTHAHLDHTMGLNFLHNVLWRHRAQHEVDLKFTFYGDAKTRAVVQEKLFDPLIFPLGWNWKWQKIEAGRPFDVAGVGVNTTPLLHPGGSLGYRFDWPQRTLSFITDTARDQSYHEFIGDTDLLIHERNFGDSSADLAEDSGHCTSSDLVAAARASGASQIAAMHFNPLVLTDPLDEDDIYQKLPSVVAATDGLILEI